MQRYTRVATVALVLQQWRSCCNRSLQRYACVATNRCNSAPVLQWCARVARNRCIKPLQRIDATECCRSIVCCNVCVATHFTVNDATRIDGSYRVLLQQTYTPGWYMVSTEDMHATHSTRPKLVVALGNYFDSALVEKVRLSSHCIPAIRVSFYRIACFIPDVSRR